MVASVTLCSVDNRPKSDPTETCGKSLKFLDSSCRPNLVSRARLTTLSASPSGEEGSGRDGVALRLL